MTAPDPSDAHDALRAAHRAERRTHEATRWFASFLVLAGLYVFGWVLLTGYVAPRTPGRYAAWAVGVVVAVALRWWVSSHEVRPRARRLLWAIMGAALGLFLAAYIPLVWLPGGGAPLARWSIVAAAAALPSFVGAWYEWRRS